MVQHSSHLLLIDITISITSMKSQVPVPDQAVSLSTTLMSLKGRPKGKLFGWI